MNTLDIKSASNPFLVDASQELDRVAEAALCSSL